MASRGSSASTASLQVGKGKNQTQARKSDEGLGAVEAKLMANRYVEEKMEGEQWTWWDAPLELAIE